MIAANIYPLLWNIVDEMKISPILNKSVSTSDESVFQLLFLQYCDFIWNANAYNHLY